MKGGETMKEITKYYEINGRHYIVRLLLVHKKRAYDGVPLHPLRIFLTIKPF